MEITFLIKSDTITSEMNKLLERIKNPQPAMNSVGTAIVRLAKGAFTDPALRPSPWAEHAPSTKAALLQAYKKKKRVKTPKKTPTFALLRRSGTLARSPRVIEAGVDFVIVGTDRVSDDGNWSIGAIHQLGAPAAKIPARPFFPFDANGNATEIAQKRTKEILLDWLKKGVARV